MSRLFAFSVAVACASCATANNRSATGSSADTEARPRGTRSEARDQPVGADAGRELGADAVYGDLVALARKLSLNGQRDSSTGCLLARGAVGYVLAADLASAFDPIPLATISLPDAAANVRATALGTFGTVGPSQSALMLAPFTSLPPDAARNELVAVLVSEEGIVVRYSDRAAEEADELSAPSELVPRLLGRGAAEHSVLVAAAGPTPLALLYEVLAELPHGTRVALAVALPAGTRAPESGGPRSQMICPAGLPDPRAGAVEGDLAAERIVAALPPLREGAARCMESGGFVGKATLAFRIGPAGAVEHACLVTERAQSRLFAACLVETATLTRFPAPSPKGYIDVHLPLELSAIDAEPQRPTCPR